MMLETSINTIVDGIGHKYFLDGYSKGLKAAYEKLAAMTAELFLDGETGSANEMREAYHAMLGLQLLAQSEHRNEGIGYLQNSAKWMQGIIDDYADPERVRPNDDNAS